MRAGGKGGRSVISRIDKARSIRIAVAAALVLVVALLVALGLLVDRGYAETARLRQDVERAYDSRAALQRLLSLHQDIELGQRGYLLTGNPRFLEPYDAAVRTLDDHPPILTDPGVAPLHAAIARASAGKRRFVERTLDLQRSGRSAAALALVRTGEGKRLMDALRVAVGQLARVERERLAQRLADAETARDRLRRATLALQLTLVVLLLATAILAARSYAARQRALARANDAAARQQAIFQSAKDGMIVINPSGSIESLNAAAAGMFGLDAAQLLRRDIGVLFEVAPDRGRVESFLRRLGANRRESYGQVQEFAGRRADGGSFPVEVSISPVRLAGATLYLAVIRDVSERRQVEQMKTEFVATVSHELRTPLTSIAGSLGLISGGAAGELPSKAARLVEIAKNNALRLVRLINDILDIEKIEAGRMHFDIRPIALDALLSRVVQQGQGFADQYDVRLDLAEPSPRAGVLADEDRLTQVLTNLISNAIKFSPAGAAVTLGVTPLDRRYRISVTDRGSGIPEAFKPRIFGKFAQADGSDTRQIGGTGLGLSIVREIVVRLGGSISFESREGEGTVFHVDLPAVTIAEPEPAEPLVPAAVPEAMARSDAPVPAGLPLVLHVDDDPDMLDLLNDAFAGQARLCSTPSVIAARTLIRTQPLDAAILDIGLIDGCGTDLAPVLRRQHPHAPIIVFTAQEAESCASDQVDLVLVKSRASLDQLVAETLRRIARGRKEIP